MEAREVEEGEGSGAQDKEGEEVEDKREKGQVEPTGEEGVEMESEMEEEAGTGIGWSTIDDLAEGLAALVAAAGGSKGCGDDNDLPPVVPVALVLVLVLVSVLV